MVQSKHIQTPGLNIHYLESGTPGKDLVILLHGNVSSALFFVPLMDELPDTYHYLAPDMRGYGDSETRPVDATRGLHDFADDLGAFLEVMNPNRKPVHLLGWSMGAGVVMQCAMSHPYHIHSLTLLSPMSPFGFGGSINKGLQLQPTAPDFAGSGGGAVNPSFIDSIRTHDGKFPSTLPEGLRAAPPSYCRSTMNGLYFKMIDNKTLLQRGVIDDSTEDLFTESMFKTKLGDGNYPGNSLASPNWPGMAPGDTGVNNAISAKYCNLSGFAASSLRLPILWIRGADDAIVSDHSLLDVNNLGKMGIIPGWPGEATHPPQPMVTQMRALLDAYKERGGQYTELVFDHCGHSPHIEYPGKFLEAFVSFLKG